MLRQIQARPERIRLSSSRTDVDSPGRLRRAQRIKIALVAFAGYWAITLIGRTVRWAATGTEHLDAIHSAGQRAIFTCWHGRIFPATWYWRNRGIVVMTSKNMDGEMIALCIQRLGYGAARGSSSRSGLHALGLMVQDLRNGRDVGFTIDGPRGPRYVAKQGPAILARKTGSAIFCFHVAMKRRIQLNSWDHFQIPLPFTRAMVFMAPPIWIPEDSDRVAVRRYHDRMQGVLDDLKQQANQWEQSG